MRTQSEESPKGSNPSPQAKLVLEGLSYDFVAWTEHYDGRIWCHCIVYHYSPKVKADIKDVLERTRERYRCDLWAAENDPGVAPNLEKWLSIYGFEPHGFVNMGGRVRQAFVNRYSRDGRQFVQHTT